MKKTMMALIVFFSSFSHAQRPKESDRFVALFQLKTAVEQMASSTEELLKQVEGYAQYYSQLNFYQLVKKTKVARLNCANVQATMLANSVMISAVIENSQEILSTLPEINNQEALMKLSKITEALHLYNTAIKNCSVVPKSLGPIKKANALLQEVHSYLEQIPNKLP